MILPFDPRKGHILIPTHIYGPDGDAIALLALDTGATQSMVGPDIGRILVRDLASIPKETKITTASSEEQTAEIMATSIEALGLERHRFPILCLELPSSVEVDGVLGLDFFRGRKLTLDFRSGWVTLE
jgi:hypothetical protein